MGRLIQDFRFAVRTFLRGRSVTVLSVLAFALGIGVTTAVFSIFNAVLLNPLPYPDPDELVIVYDTQPALATAARPRSPSTTTGKAAIRCSRRWADPRRRRSCMTGSGDPSASPAMSTTASLAEVLRRAAAIGRWYTEQEDQPGGPKVVVLSIAFWTTALRRRSVGHRPHA